MTRDFQILTSFLDRYAVEVEGREGDPPSRTVLDRLQRFARGELDEARREELIRTLHEHRDWVAALAAAVAAVRPAQNPRP